MALPTEKHARNQACVIPEGFTVLSLRFSSDSPARHSVFVKEHRVRAERSSGRPLDRTLFVLNVPPYCSEAVVKDLFSQFGSVRSAELRDHPGSSESGPKLSRFFRPAGKQGFKVAYVVFESPSSVAAAKSHPQDEPLVVCTELRPVQTGVQSVPKLIYTVLKGNDPYCGTCEGHSGPVSEPCVTFKGTVGFFPRGRTGLWLSSAAGKEGKSFWFKVQGDFIAICITSEWIQQYTRSFIHTEELQQTVDSFMQDFDLRKEQEAEREKQEAEKQQEDEEGWVKVTRGHKGAKARPHSEAANQRTLQREKSKKRRKELLNFYTWQHKNTQKEHIAELRKKFEEDKQRIALMRAQRKFRPY